MIGGVHFTLHIPVELPYTRLGMVYTGLGGRRSFVLVPHLRHVLKSLITRLYPRTDHFPAEVHKRRSSILSWNRIYPIQQLGPLLREGGERPVSTGSLLEMLQPSAYRLTTLCRCPQTSQLL